MIFPSISMIFKPFFGVKTVEISLVICGECTGRGWGLVGLGVVRFTTPPLISEPHSKATQASSIPPVCLNWLT